MKNLVYIVIKFSLIWWLISKGIFYYDKRLDFINQNILGALLLILPCVVGWERILSDFSKDLLKTYFNDKKEEDGTN